MQTQSQSQYHAIDYISICWEEKKNAYGFKFIAYGKYMHKYIPISDCEKKNNHTTWTEKLERKRIEKIEIWLKDWNDLLLSEIQ